MTNITWKPNANGYWNVAANWSGGVVPGAADNVTLTSTARHTVYFTVSDTVAGLISTNDMLGIASGDLTVTGPTNLAGGFSETGGTLTLLGAVNTLSGGIAIGSGDIVIGTGDVVTLAGAVALGTTSSPYGAHIYGAGTLVTTGALSIANGGGSTNEAWFGAGLVWNNTGTVTDAGLITAYYTPGIAFTINNLAGAVFNFSTDIACVMNMTIYNNYGNPVTASSDFNNTGTMAKTGGTGTTTFYATLTSTGTINVQTGTLALFGGGVIGGLVEGPGTLALDAGGFTLAAGLVEDAAALLINGAVVTLASNLTPAGAVNMTAGTLELNGFNLTAPAATLNYSTLDGAGTLSTSGTTDDIYFYVGGGADWVNSGTVDQAGGPVYLTDGNGAGTLTNLAGATYDFTDDNGIGIYYQQGGTLVNAGTLEKTGGTNTSNVYTALVDTGVVDAASGTIEFDGGGNIGGTLEGAGQIAFGQYNPAYYTLAANTDLAVASLLIDGGNLTLGGSFNYAGNFAITGGGIELNGYNFTVTSPYLYNGYVDGAGTFASSGTLSTGNFTMGGGADWVNSGTINEGGGTDFIANGNGNGTLTNLAGAIFNFTDDNGLGYAYDGSYIGGVFNNAGTLAKIGGTNSSQVYATINSTGTIDVATGTVQFNGGGTIAGDVTGAGTVAFGNNAQGLTTYATLASGTTLSVAGLLITAGVLTIENSYNYAGALSMSGGTLELNGYSFSDAANYLNGGTVDGSGTFYTSGITSTQYFSVGGSADWVNSGTVYESVYDYLSDGNGAGTITNLAGATFVFTNINDYGIQPNGSGGTFVNAGTLTTSGAGAEPSIYAVINSTGTISAASGTILQFEDGGSISGALTGAGQIAFGDYNNLYNYALAAGTSLTISNLYIDGGNLTLNSSYTYAGGFAITSGTLELNGYNFSSAAPYLGGGTIDGPGTFSTSGAIAAAGSQQLYVGGGADWVNSGTITESNGYVYLDDGNGAGTLTNQAGAVYDFTQNYYGIFNYSGTFINAGLIEDTASPSSFTYFQAAADSTGTISVVTAGSTLDFDGGGTFAGQINGKGAVEFDGGVNFGNLTIAATTTLNLNAGVNMFGNVSIASSFAGSSNEYPYFELNGFILTLSGTDLFGSAAGYSGSMDFDTAGTVTTTGTDSVSDNGPSNSDVELYISGNADWNNTGKFSDAGAIQIGYNDGAGTITNAGAFDFTTDDGQIYNGNSYNISDTLVPVIGAFVNTGTLAKTTGTGTNSVDATIFNTGTISTDAGTIAFADGGTLGGKILASSHILLSGGDFILNNLTAGGTITDAAQIDQTGAITLGNTGAGVLIIDGIYNIDNNSSIAIATSTSSMSIVSGGTFAKTGGTGTATIAASIADNGVILAEAGDLKLSTISGAGTATISNGASLELTASVAAGIIVTMGTSSDLLLDSPATFKGKIANFVSGDTIDLGGLTVTSATAASTGTLTLLNGSSTVGSVLLTGNPSGDVFSTATDGHGGTLLQTKSADSWKATSGDWTVATDWTAGVPGPGTDATISGSNAETITLGASENDFAHSLTLSDSKATLDINGTLNLATAFAQTAGTVELAGTINGGTVNVTGGDFVISGYYDTFNNVLFEGNVDLTQTNAQLNVLGNGGFTGAGGIGGTTMAITGNNAGFFAEGIDALVNATISLGSNNTAYLEDYDPYDTGALLTLGTAVTVTQSGLYADIGDYNTFDTDGLFNSGAITGAVRGGTLAIVGNLFENDGIIKISNGDTLNITTATFTNNGTLSVSGSTLILDSANPTLAGTINITNSTLDLADSLSTGQLLSYLSASNTVNLSGTLNNTGAALNLTTTSPISAFTLNGGTIIGGTVIAPAAGLAITSGELLNVTEDGALKLVGSTINNAAGTAPGAISVTNASIEFDGYTSINNNISLSNATLFITGGTLNTNLSTGVDATGNPLAEGSADPFWADSYTGGQATVLNNNFWLGSGVPLNTAANMIGVYDSSSEPPPPYTFTEVFTLTAAQAASALLVGSFFVDNGGSLILNGNTLDSYSDNLIPENIGDASYFQAGANTLTIELTAGDQSYDGAYFYGGLVVPTTIAAGATVQGTGLVTDQPAGDGASAIVNAGVIAANVSGGVLDVAPTLFDNQGTMTATNGATLEINASGWVNAGSISVNNATLDLGGSFTTPSFAGISNTGGAINLSGTLNNTGGTLSVGAGTSLGTLGVADYSNIIGGTIADAGGGMSFTGDGIFDLNGPTFTGVTYEGALNVTEANINLFITNGISLTGANGTGTGTLKLTGQNSRLEFTNSTTLNNATITFGSSGGGQTYGDSIDVYDPAGQPLTLTLGPAETVIDNIANSNANFGDPFGQGNNLVVNQGTIAAAAAGVNVYVSQNPLTNNGLLEAINGGTIDLNGSIGAFPGLTNLNGTTLTGGTYSVGANSVIELLNNTSIVTDAADIILSGAASNIQAYNGASQITLDKTLATIAAGGTLALSAGRNWSGTLAFVDQGDLNLSGTTFKAASLTVASTGTIAGAGTVSNTVVNNGLIQAQGGALTLSALSGTGSLKIASGATLDIAGGAVATETVTFSGDPATLKIDNAGSFKAVLANLGAGDTIDFSTLASATATISGTTLTVKQGSTAYTYSINSLAAGTVLTTGSDGHSGTDITFFRQAVPSGHSPEPVAFGQVHAGSAQTQTLSIGNIAAADGYSEALDATIGSASSVVTAAGSIVRLAAGSNSTALSVSLGDSATGTESGTAVITLASDGTGIDGFGTTALPSQTVNVTGTVFAYATASLGTSTAAIGNVHQGATASQMVTLTNTGAVSGGFTEGLDAGIAGVTGSVSGTGTVTLLGAGSASSALVVGFATGTAGAISGAVTIGLVSDGTGIDTLSSTTLASQTVAVTGAVYDYAGPSLASAIISLGNVHVGAADNAALTISNLTTNAAYTEGLDASFSGTSGAATDLGSLLLLGAGLSNSASLDVGILDTASGSYSGSATLSLVSDGALTSGLGTTGLGSDTITVTGAVYALASPSLASTIINLGVIHAGAAAADTLSITNFTTNATYTEALDAGFLGTTGSITASGTEVLLAAGATDSSDLVLTLATGTSGSISGVATLGLISDGAGTSNLGTTALGSANITLAATVDNYATASVAKVSGAGTLTETNATNYTLSFGSVLKGAAAPTANLEVLNSAIGLADLLGGSFTVKTVSSAISNTGIGTFSGLGAGQADTSPVVKLATTASGTDTEVLVISSTGSNASGYSGTLSPITLTITGIVADVFTLTTGADDFVGGPGNDLFIAAAGALSAGDTLNGGAGLNTLSLSGGGTFDMTQPATLSSIQTVLALEAAGAAAQTVYLRSGYTGTLTAVSGAAGTGITIYGNTDSATIKLGNGNDTVFVGANTETITAGNGNSVFNITSATSAVKITAGSGANTLAVSGGGTVTMGSGITNVNTVTLNDTGVGGTSFIANTDSKLVINGGAGADTITLGAATQTVAAGTGTTLVKGVIGDAGALITANSPSTTTLDLTTGGTGTLNANDTNLTVTLSAATNLTLSKMGFITVDGSSGNDTLTALAANQTLTGGLGTDTLTGYASFGDLFLDTAAGLNGDTIKNFGGSDLVDLTNINSSMVTSLGWQQVGTGGKLTVSDGTNTALINFSGTYTAASFTFGSDGTLGTYIHFV